MMATQRSVKGNLFPIICISEYSYPSCMWPAGDSRGPRMEEPWLSHSEFTICCSARVPRRLPDTGGIGLMLVTQAHPTFYYFFIILLLFISTVLSSVFPGHFFKVQIE